MIRFIARRVFFGLIVLFGVIVITFVLARVVPSNPAAKWAGLRATPSQIEKAKIELGLDKPLPVQFWRYFKSTFRGDFGRSLRTQQPIISEIKARLPATLELVLISTLAAVLIGIPLGVISAHKNGTWIDHLSRLFSVGVISFPTFWIALVLQLVFFRILGVFPLGGQLSMRVQLTNTIPSITGFLTIDSLLVGNLTVWADAMWHLVLPGITIAMFPIGLVARMTRSALLEILGEEYIVAARSYGLSERMVIWSYALKNSLGPTVTVVALSIGSTLVGTFLTEAIFSWPGIGSYIATAVVGLDYPAIMGVTIFSTVAYVVLNMIADIVVALDPRVRV